MARFTAGSAAKYIVLPGILPRIRALFFDGFSLLAYYIALIYGMARIIPAGHPYLNQANIGKFGILEAVFAAWGHLDFKWKNIDRILFFFALLSGLVLMLAYILGAFFYLWTAPAMAASMPQIGTLFTNPNPADDLAFIMLDRMLGIPGVFDSKVITTNEFGQMPTPFHHGLQALFAYFSWGMFGIAIVMLLYFVVDIVLETTITGKPFGKRFQNPWVPLRLIAGIGLLIPISYGLNSAQWITLYVAKAGSNFATNAWVTFNGNMLNPMGMENKELVSLPTTPDFTGLAKDLFMIRSCKDVDQKLAVGRRAATATPTTPSDPNEIVVTGASKQDVIDAFFVDGDRYFTILGRKSQVGKSWPDDYASNFINLYTEGLRFYNGKDVRIVFGRFNEKWLAEGKYPGGVEPVCGEILIPNSLRAGDKVPTGNIQNSEVNEGILIGASHMFAVLKMTIGISKTGFADEGDHEDEYEYYMLRAATDRSYYQDTSQGQKKLREHRQKVQANINDDPSNPNDYGNPECPNDSNNDGIDDEGDDFVFNKLGKCDGPVGNEFYLDLTKRYQKYLSYGPTMGYDYYTGRGQTVLNEQCARIDCSTAVSGAQGTNGTCERVLKVCNETRDGYADYKPLSSVYYEDLGQSNPFMINRALNSGLLRYGWGGAGIWYQVIAERNGDLSNATNALPRTVHYPKMMEKVSEEKATRDQSAEAGCDKYNPAVAGSGQVQVGNSLADSNELSKMYYTLCGNLHENEHLKMAGSTVKKNANPLINIINALFANDALYNFRNNEMVNPMAQLAGLGRALIDKAIQNIMLGTGGAAVGGLASLFGNIMGDGAGQILSGAGAITSSISSLMVSFAMTGLVAGILLFYVIPFLPFLYFFFAVGTWVKTIFEALVGIPLWALAHLRIDDTPGFSGKAASGGYFMLLEIFVRPIVTLFALVGSMFIFMALAYMLNITFGVVTANLVGYDPMAKLSTNMADVAYWRPKLDQFLFTIIYVIFMYMLATGSFKLIDHIPDGIMRWLDGVKTWGVNDSADAMVQDISMTVGLPTQQMLGPIVTKGSEVIGKIPGGTVGGVMEMQANLKNFMPKSGGPE